MVGRNSVLVVVGFALVSVSLLCFSAAPDESFQRQFNLPQDPDNLLREILTRKEFQEASAWSLFDRLYEHLETLFERVVRWLLNRVPEIGPVDADFDVVWMILVGLLIGAAVIGTAWLLRKWLISLIGKVRSLSGAYQEPMIGDVGAPVSGQILKQALAAAEQGDYSGALVSLFRFTLMRLDETGRLVFHPGKTNREILQSLKPDGPISGSLTEMVPLFNRVRYGNAPCSKADYERVLGLCRAVTERL